MVKSVTINHPKGLLATCCSDLKNILILKADPSAFISSMTSGMLLTFPGLSFHIYPWRQQCPLDFFHRVVASHKGDSVNLEGYINSWVPDPQNQGPSQLMISGLKRKHLVTYRAFMWETGGQALAHLSLGEGEVSTHSFSCLFGPRAREGIGSFVCKKIY